MKWWQWLALSGGAVALVAVATASGDKRSYPSRRLPEDDEEPPRLDMLLSGETRTLSSLPTALLHYRPRGTDRVTFGIPELNVIIEDELSEIRPFFTPAPGGSPNLTRSAAQYRAALWDVISSGAVNGPESIVLARLPVIRAAAKEFLKPNMGPADDYIRTLFFSLLSGFAYSPFGGPGYGTDYTQGVCIEKDSQKYARRVGPGRRSFSPLDKVINIAFPGTPEAIDVAGHVWHEATHVIEQGNPRFALAAAAFLRSRTSRERLVPLLKIFPDSSFNPDERVRPDRFISPYCGKEYPRLTTRDRTSNRRFLYAATEIFSTGVELFSKGDANLGVFWKKDPEHFALISAFFRGKLGFFKG